MSNNLNNYWLIWFQFEQTLISLILLPEVPSSRGFSRLPCLCCNRGKLVIEQFAKYSKYVLTLPLGF